jgi:hypothetical protein
MHDEQHSALLTVKLTTNVHVVLLQPVCQLWPCSCSCASRQCLCDGKSARSRSCRGCCCSCCCSAPAAGTAPAASAEHDRRCNRKITDKLVTDAEKACTRRHAYTAKQAPYVCTCLSWVRKRDCRGVHCIPASSLSFVCKDTAEAHMPCMRNPGQPPTTRTTWHKHCSTALSPGSETLFLRNSFHYSVAMPW